MAEFEIGFGVDAVLKPKSIAVIGVSARPEKQNVTGGTAVVANLIRYGYAGKIYPVNPRYTQIMGIKCWPSVEGLPESPDLAVISVAAEQVPDVLLQCAEAGVRAAIVVSSGFSEIQTPSGEALQNEIKAICIKYGIRVVGPNNLGSYNVYDRIMASTSTALFYYDEVKAGGIAWITQSGALGSTIQARAMDRGIGLSYVISSGNECDLCAADFIWYLSEDPRVEVIGVYAEEIHDWKNFSLAVGKARANGKPVLVYKSGVTSVGAAAVKAHTGSTAGKIDENCQLFKRCGAIQVESIDELYETAYLVEKWKPYKRVANYGIIAISGGEGAVVADGLRLNGLDVPRFSERTLENVAKLIPYFGSAQNPIDVTAHMMRTPEKVAQVMEVLENADEIDAVIYALTTVAKEWEMVTAKSIADQIRNNKKPGLVCWFSSRINEKAVQYLREQNVPVFTNNNAMIQALVRKKQLQETEDK